MKREWDSLLLHDIYASYNICLILMGWISHFFMRMIIP